MTPRTNTKKGVAVLVQGEAAVVEEEAVEVEAAHRTRTARRVRMRPWAERADVEVSTKKGRLCIAARTSGSNTALMIKSFKF